MNASLVRSQRSEECRTYVLDESRTRWIVIEVDEMTDIRCHIPCKRIHTTAIPHTVLGHAHTGKHTVFGTQTRTQTVPAKVEEAAGHIGVVVVRLLLPVLPVALHATLATLVEVGRHVDTGAVLQERLSRLLQTTHLSHVLQH